jgi:hypothetical protein
MSDSRTESLKHLLSSHGGHRGEKILTAMAIAEMSRPWYNWYNEKRQTIEHREVYTLVVDGFDPSFADLNQWIIDNLPTIDRKSMIVSTRNREPYITLKYNGRRAQSIDVDGHRIGVSLGGKDASESNVPLNVPLNVLSARAATAAHEQMTFTCESIEARDAVLKLIKDFAKPDFDIDDKDSTPDLWMPAKGTISEWRYRGDLPPRRIDSVVLKNGQLERICADIEHFFETEERYNRLCMPYHRGYLFHGPPGTGKTSAARAIANKYQLPVYYLPLGDVEKDANLTDLISQIEISGGAVLLLEDIDSYHVSTERDQAAGQPSSAALLNSLDGIWTPHGLVTIMTTNHVDRLDPALIRAGRIGLSEEFSPMDLDQVLRMCTYLEFEPENPESYVGASPADLMEAAARVALDLIEVPS